MKCPYAVNKQMITQCKIEYEEETEKQTSWSEIQNQKVSFADCIEKRCGAYYDGRCHYKN